MQFNENCGKCKQGRRPQMRSGAVRPIGLRIRLDWKMMAMLPPGEVTLMDSEGYPHVAAPDTRLIPTTIASQTLWSISELLFCATIVADRDLMHFVLLPGLDGTGLLFTDFVSALASDVEVTVVQYPGDRALNYAEHESVARLSLPCDRPYIILGESFSGPIAISLAAANPPGLVGLILCCTFARNPLPFYAHFRSFLKLIPFSLIPKVFQSPFIFGRFSSQSLRAQHRKAVSLVTNDALSARIKAIFEVDVTAKLHQVTLPILYLQASEDHVIPKAASEYICRVAPDVRIVELKAPHLLLQTIPSSAAAIVSEFAREAMDTQPGRCCL